MSSRSFFAIKGLGASRSIWKQQSEAKTTGWIRQLATHCWKLLEDIKKNICRVENTDIQELDHADCFRLQNLVKTLFVLYDLC